MKKLLSLLAVMLIAISADALAPFTYYRPLQPSNNYSDSYSNNRQSTSPFTYYSPLPDPSSNYRPAPKQQSKTYNLTGYYQDSKGWHTASIKVTITGDKAVLSAYKYGNYWMNNSATVCELDYYDSDEVKENFNYKARTTHLGVVYF